ncbi:hypothetical protein [Fictibacillus phosphorivorans]|uniref:hypothetical protein n=1 Tax=Fictibacillus phosphorivorans TaxID=1221500 RepID=UPI00203C7ECA|nr:hypothetical protein [Fictibacillus phosphorivorans]MCM3718726.1 hypothetical protein [Fictibacillus phosphorivorans]MCM3776349.1 hypothetical protein [Fictibacillus phosphorivorans]
MFLFTIICLTAFYLLTREDTLRFKQITWSAYGVIDVTFLIGFLSIQPDTPTYVFWIQLFFLLLSAPVLILVVRKLWEQNKNMPAWVKYTVSIPVSLLFVVTLWFCWHIFPIVMYIF